MARLDDFLDERDYSFFNYDVNRLKELPIEEFAKMRVEKMKFFMGKYVESHDGGFPICFPCSKQIETADNLVRYFGRYLHNKCFLEEYGNDIFDLGIHDKEYFGLVKRAVEMNALARI